jgi:hypothetical protein
MVTGDFGLLDFTTGIPSHSLYRLQHPDYFPVDRAFKIIPYKLLPFLPGDLLPEYH